MTDLRVASRPWAVPAALVATVAAGGAVVPSAAAGPTAALAIAIGVAIVGLTSVGVLRRRPLVISPADGVTLARLVLVGACGALAVLALAGEAAHRSWLLLSLVVPALLLDLVDGPVARRTGTSGPGGAAFDNNADAALVAVMSVLVAPVVGWWVLAIGAMRYVYVAASWVRPALRGPLEPSRLRRLIGAFQGVALAIAVAPVLPEPALRVLLAVALGTLVYSFGRDAVGLERAARPAQQSLPATGQAAPATGQPAPAIGQQSAPNSAPR